MPAKTGKAARLKGYAYQRDIAHALEAAGWTIIRRSGGEAGDDITVVNMPWLSIEVKNHARGDVAGWWKQAQAQAGDRVPVLVHKRHGVADPSEQWVTLTVAEFTRLMACTAKGGLCT